MKSIDYLKTPLSQEIFQTLKDRIISGEYPPKVILSEKEISQEFGVSRTPYRDAVKKLEELKLIEVIPRFGTYVSEIDLNEVWNAFEVRLKLEHMAGELAAQKRTAEQLKRLESVVKEAQILGEDSDHNLASRLDKEFHEIIVSSAHNPVLAEMLERLHNICARIFSSSFRKRLSLPKLVSQWENVYRAVKNGDGDAAAEVMVEHIQYSLDHFKNELL